LSDEPELSPELQRWIDGLTPDECEAVVERLLDRRDRAPLIADVEQTRDALVEELIDTLMFTDLGQQSINVRIERRGPGWLKARFDANTYLITVRADPAQADIEG
jgi:hypothetical protein